jgi:putative DNA primase/helicase
MNVEAVRAADRLVCSSITAVRQAQAAPVLNGKAVLESTGATDLLSQHFSDYGNAQRIVAMHGEVARYCHDFKCWMLFDGRRWERDTADRMRHLSQDTVLEFARQAVHAGNETATKFAGSCLNSHRITAAIREAQPHLVISAAELDTHPFLLNFLNGTVDLRTGTLLSHDRDQRISKIVQNNYRAYATCPQFSAFLRRIVPGLEKYLQRAVGYSLTGTTSEKVVHVCYGGGNNGKTTFLSTLLSLLGEYAVLLQVDTLMVGRESNNSQADLADLKGARFAMTSETEEGQKLADGKLKRICQGMGKIKATRKYENPVEFAETHKLWLDCNHKPVVRGTDNAIWNRLHLIPFEVTISPEDIDRDLPLKLLAEAEGILAWAVEGAVGWHAEGLARPAKIDAASKEWRRDSDQIGRFIGERCVVGEGTRAKARPLYTEYRKWAQEGGEDVTATEKDFSAVLIRSGFKRKHVNTGEVYEGVGLGIQAQEVME